MTAKKTIAVFDFDETLVYKDSLIDFASHSVPGLIFFYKSLLFVPTFLRFKAKKIDNQTTKEAFLTLFFQGTTEDAFNTLCGRYADRLNAITNTAALKKVRWHQQKGHKVIIVSASASSWITPWAKQHNFNDVIATQLEFRHNKLTGKLVGKNCHGPEKAKRFLEAYPKRDGYELIVYGDGKSDREIFKLADKYYEKRFN